jgi:hypothetical protein
MDAMPSEAMDTVITVTQLATWGLALLFAAVLMLGFYLSRLLRSVRHIEAQLLRSVQHVESQLHRHAELLSWMGKISSLTLEEARGKAQEPAQAPAASESQGR